MMGRLKVDPRLMEDAGLEPTGPRVRKMRAGKSDPKRGTNARQETLRRKAVRQNKRESVTA